MLSAFKLHLTSEENRCITIKISSRALLKMDLENDLLDGVKDLIIEEQA